MTELSSNIKHLSEWNLISSTDISEDGSILSSPQQDVSDWYRAEVPSTVLASLVSNGVYKNPYFGKNLNDIPTEQFKVPWWYRTEFEISEIASQQTIKYFIKLESWQ